MSSQTFVAEHMTAILLAGAIVTALAIRMRFVTGRLQQSQSWPHTTATIQSVTVTPLAKGTDYLVAITYSYFVAEYRSGEYERLFSNESEANYFALHIKDGKVDVRYNPQEPGSSILDDTATAPFVEFDKPWL